jgi:hypothetical protein
MEGSQSSGRGAVHSGLLTGISTAAVSGSAAVLGVILSRKFGHGVKTDGFFAAYGVYLALVLIAGSLRVVLLPRFANARTAGRLPQEVGTWSVGLAGPLAAVVLLSIAWPDGIARAITSSPSAREQAAALFPWIVPSAVAQIYGGLVASALAAYDDYASAAFGFAVGSIIGVAATIVLVGHGIVAFGWGLALNGVISLAIPVVPLALRGGVGLPDAKPWRRLLELGDGVALPLALQGFYVVAYRFASGLGTGEATTFSYAYLLAAFLVAVTAGSGALVSTVPFAREGNSPVRAARHVAAISWISLALVVAAAGVFALAGASIVHRVLGSSYGGGTGTELGRLVVYLVPWMVASVALTVAFPLVFVRGRPRWLPLLALGALVVDIGVEWALTSAFELPGLALGLGVTTSLVLFVLLQWLGALTIALRAIVVATLTCGVLGLVAYGLPRLVLGPIAAAVAGLIAYLAVLALWRPPGLRQAWAYMRALQ